MAIGCANYNNNYFLWFNSFYSNFDYKLVGYRTKLYFVSISSYIFNSFNFYIYNYWVLRTETDGWKIKISIRQPNLPIFTLHKSTIHPKSSLFSFQTPKMTSPASNLTSHNPIVDVHNLIDGQNNLIFEVLNLKFGPKDLIWVLQRKH